MEDVSIFTILLIIILISLAGALISSIGLKDFESHEETKDDEIKCNKS